MNTFKFKPLKQTQSGLTLVEIMVAVVISLILMAGVGQIYLSNKKTYRMTDAISRIQENGRFALNFIMHEIRGAGNMGCLNLETMKIKNNLNPGGAGFEDFSDGFDGINGDEDGVTSAKDKPDTLILSGVDDGGASVTTPYMVNTAANLKVKTVNNLQKCQILLVSDCQSGDIFQNTATNADTNGTVGRNTGNAACADGPGNTGVGVPFKMSKAYGEDARVFALTRKTFSIANGTSGRPSLFFDDGTRTATGLPNGAQELVEGVENMQILYGVDGIDTDTVPDYYVSWAAGLDMSRVVSIRVSLLLSTIEDNITEDNQTYTYNGGNATAADRRLYKVFEATVAIRNRLK